MLQKERKNIYNTIIKSITTYGCEVRQNKKNTGFGIGLLAQISKNI
jgi:hypothetical protein